MKNRAALHRRLGLPDADFCMPEYSIAFAATSNTIATLCWFFLNVFESPERVERIREEVGVLTAVEGEAGARRATVDISRLDKECPTLFACYRETLRLYSDTLGNRRVMEDTTLRDPATGREYLLRKGLNVQWPARLPHLMSSIWGPDAHLFRPDRWLDETTSADEKQRRAAMIPFGGGKTLCPGRYFAQAENLGLVAAVALGFVVEGAGAPGAGVAYMGTAMKRPEGDSSAGVKLRRREGWEDVTWDFKC